MIQIISWLAFGFGGIGTLLLAMKGTNNFLGWTLCFIAAIIGLGLTWHFKVWGSVALQVVYGIIELVGMWNARSTIC